MLITANSYRALPVCETLATYIIFIIPLQHPSFTLQLLLFAFALIFDLICIRPGSFQLQETVSTLTDLSPKGNLLAHIIKILEADLLSGMARPRYTNKVLKICLHPALALAVHFVG